MSTRPKFRKLHTHLRRLERAEQVPPLLWLRRTMLQRVQHEHLQQLLVRDSDLDGHPGRTVLLVPALHQRHVENPSRVARAEIERTRSPHESLKSLIRRLSTSEAPRVKAP